MGRPGDNLRASAERLWGVQHPRARNDSAAASVPNETVIGEAVSRPGELLVVSILAPAGTRRLPMLALRQWHVGPDGRPRVPTRFGILVHARAVPEVATLLATALDMIAREDDSAASWDEPESRGGRR